MKELVVLLAAFALSSARKCNVDTPPVWPSAYTVKGVIQIPYAELNEPFQGWYDANKGNSRIDYYGGTDKTFQLSSYPTKTGSNIKIVPVTTEEYQNEVSCMKVDGDSEGDVIPQPLLPEMTDFTCVEHGSINGIQGEKWTQSVQIEEKISNYTMWIRWKKNQRTRELTAIPIYYEMKGYDSLIGSHYDHYYLSYHDYKQVTPADKVWELPAELTCTGYPGPGIKDVATFNPMKEFVSNYDNHINDAWSKFLTTHGKEYQNETSEHALRKHLFKQNHRLIHSHNRANHGYKLALNHLADRTDDELRSLRGRKSSTTSNNGGSPFPYSDAELHALESSLPKKYDWRIFGAVTPVKDQSICGSCWSFGTTGTIEGANFVKTGQLLSLSEQALIDCSWGYGNNGCDGGEDFRSYSWIMKHGGIPLESEYGPYLGDDGECHIDKVRLVSPITGWVNVTSRKENALKTAIFNHGPVSISINAALKTFSFYSNGLYYDPDCNGEEEDLDHSVLAVGFGWFGTEKYWLVKNSWSNLWGNDGYILMAVKNNNCGVMTSPTYVTLQ